MPKLLIVTWAGGGNVDPTVGIVQRLLDERISIEAIGPASLVPRFAALGVPLKPRDAAGERDQAVMAADVAAALEHMRPDLVLVDYMMPGALCATEAASVPTAVLVHTLYGGMHVHDDGGPMWNAATVDGTNALRAELGLPAITEFGRLLDRARAVLVTCPRELDDVPEPLAANVHYVGPVFERLTVEPPAATGRARVVVSLGSTDMDERAVLERILAALATEPFDVVATVGDHLDPATVTAPANAAVSGRVPHAAVIPGAAVVVCHAGLGTILAALRHGVPVVCVPLGRDQPANAAAVVAAGLGRAVARDATAGAIREAVAALAGDSPARDAAAAFAAAMTEPARHSATDVLLDALAPR